VTRAIPVPSADEQLVSAVNKKSTQHENVEVPPGQKLAIVILPLAPAVGRADYPALKEAVQSIQGIEQGVTLLLDGMTPASIPEHKGMLLKVTGKLIIYDIPVPEPPLE